MMEDFKGKPFIEKEPISLFFCERCACHYSKQCEIHPGECHKVPLPKVVTLPGQS